MNISEQLAAFAAETNNELFDPDFREGEWMVDAVETHDTLDDFIKVSEDWNECSRMERGEIAGFPFVCWERIQPFKGDQRRSLSVIDFGEVRYALETNLTLF